MRLLHKTSAMESLRKWFYKPKRDDRSLLAQFFYADETLNMVAAELDSFDGREDPLRCSVLVNQLRHAQEHVLNITGQIMDQLLGSERVPRDFRVKFPEDVLQENLAGQLWFGAECLAAGSSIMNREEESAAMRPLAKALTRSLETVRRLLREHCLRCNQLTACTHILHESLNILDRLFAEFELCYVSAMVPVKSPREFEVQQHICVLFSETLQRARKIGLLTQEQVDDYDPALMFAIPRLSIVSGLLIYSAGPLSIAKSPDQMSDMFRPFRTLLLKIRSLLWTLDRRELYLLEKLLCTNEDTPSWRLQDHQDVDVPSTHYPEISSYVSRFYSDHSHCRDVLEEMGWSQDTKQGTSSIITADDYLPEDMEIAPILESMQRLDDIVAQQTLPANLTQSHVLSMFDPLAEGPSSSGFSPATSDGNVLLPDQTLVSNLSDQVSEIADKLSAISYSEQTQNPAEYPRNFTSMDGNMINNQMYSFSSNDVSSLVPNPTEQQEYQMARDNVNFSPSRSDKVISQLNNMPSTSAGYLIPNAISQEPIILAAMSNSAILLDDGGIINPINSSLIMNHSDNMLNFDSDYENAMGTTNYLINDGFQNRFTIPQEIQNITIEDHNVEELGCSASERIVAMESVAEEDSNCERNKSRILVGYGESDLNEPVANDSGICTENTSLDRSPDSEIRDLNSEQQPVHYRDQNCMLNNENKNIDDCKREMKNVYSSDSTGTVRISVNGGDFSQDQSVSSLQMNYAETSGSVVKNEAGTSHADFSPSLSTTQTSNTEQIENVMHMSNGTHMSNAVQTSSAEQMSSVAQASSDISDSDNVANKTCDNLGRNDQTNNDSLAKTKTPSSRDLRRTQSAGDVHPGSSSGWMPSLSQKKPKRTSSSTRSSSSRFPRRLSSRVWSQGRVMLENRSYVQRVSPVKLNLDQLVEDSLAGSCSSQSSATSSFHSETADDEEIALALQAQELAARRHIRTTSSEDLIHRLFVCIAGVADQLQTNFASDLRNILKSVFIMNQTPEVVEPEKEEEEEPQQQEDEETQQPVVNNKEETIEYQVSESEVLTNGDSFDSIYSAEEVYADNSPTSQRSRQSLQLDDDNAVLDENAQNDLNERRNSQPSQHSRSNNSVARRNTTISVYKNADNQSSSSMRSSSSNEQEAQEFSESNLVKEELRLISAKCEVAGEGQPGQGVAPRPVERAPEWVPDVAAPDCMLCSAHFTAFRRRHHCRNCGKVFCASCSANSIPLPRFGQLKPVRVCEECYRNLGRSHITEHDSPQQQRMQTAGRSQS